MFKHQRTPQSQNRRCCCNQNYNITSSRRIPAVEPDRASIDRHQHADSLRTVPQGHRTSTDDRQLAERGHPDGACGHSCMEGRRPVCSRPGALRGGRFGVHSVQPGHIQGVCRLGRLHFLSCKLQLRYISELQAKLSRTAPMSAPDRLPLSGRHQLLLGGIFSKRHIPERARPSLGRHKLYLCLLAERRVSRWQRGQGRRQQSLLAKRRRC